MLILYTCTWIPVLDNAGAVVTSYRIILYPVKDEASNHEPEKKIKCTLWKKTQNF
jgi:hypothetical protein